MCTEEVAPVFLPSFHVVTYFLRFLFIESHWTLKEPCSFVIFFMYLHSQYRQGLCGNKTKVNCTRSPERSKDEQQDHPNVSHIQMKKTLQGGISALPRLSKYNLPNSISVFMS